MERGPFIHLTRGPILVDRLMPRLNDDPSGGLVLFIGRVRDERGRRDTVLFYEAYPPLATKEMERLAKVAMRKFGSRRVVMVHRLGHLATGEVAVVVGVAAAHRKEAFAACRFLIDRIKQEVPIWKTVEKSTPRQTPRRKGV
jgi:molybdopterin synthase catalytic subunit